MRIKMKIGSWGAAAMLAALCLAPTNAFAEGECSSDSDCGENFVCSMSTAPCARPMPPCDSVEGEACPEPPACEPETVGYCTPAPPDACDTAADCDAGLVCVTYTYEICSGSVTPDCAPNSESCPEPQEQPDPECSTESEGVCLPPYLAPCEAAADCGEGFKCKAQEVCACSGSGGISVDPGAPDGGEEGSGEGSSEVPIEDCSCEPGDVKYCELIQQECDSDADCAGDLVCAELPGGNVSSPDTACATGPDGTTVCEESDDDTESNGNGEATRYCLPADLDRWIGGGYPGGSQDDTANHEGGPYLPGGEGSDFDGNTRDVVGTEVDRGNAASGSDANEDGGCGCASTGDSLPGSAAAIFLALLGMVGLRRRT